MRKQGDKARQVNYSLVKRSIGKKEREESNQTPKAELASAPPKQRRIEQVPHRSVDILCNRKNSPYHSKHE